MINYVDVPSGVHDEKISLPIGVLAGLSKLTLECGGITRTYKFCMGILTYRDKGTKVWTVVTDKDGRYLKREGEEISYATTKQ